METTWGPGKEKAKGQLGNFLKGAEDPRECVPFTGELLLSEARDGSPPWEPGCRPPAPPGAGAGGGWGVVGRVWTLIRNICSWRPSSQARGRSNARGLQAIFTQGWGSPQPTPRGRRAGCGDTEAPRPAGEWPAPAFQDGPHCCPSSARPGLGLSREMPQFEAQTSSSITFVAGQTLGASHAAPTAAGQSCLCRAAAVHPARLRLWLRFILRAVGHARWS